MEENKNVEHDLENLRKSCERLKVLALASVILFVCSLISLLSEKALETVETETLAICASFDKFI